MKKSLIIIFLFFILFTFGQNEKIIKGNLNNTVFFHFDSQITSSYIGNDNYIFMFDKNNNANLGVLKILEENTKPSNLLITTKSGLIYSFILKYEHNLTNFNYFIKPSEAINYNKLKSVLEVVKTPATISETPITEQVNNIDSLVVENDKDYGLQSISNVKNLYLHNKNLYFEKEIKKNIDDKAFYFKTLVSKNGLIFQLLNIKYNKDELYFYYEIKNKRLVDLDIDYMTFEITSKSNKLRASSQAIEQKPLYIYNSPKVVKGNSKTRFVAVFKKFTISKKKVFLTSIKEKNGERDIYIPITYKQVNDPN